MITAANAYVQTTTRARIRGRAMALYHTIFMGDAPVDAPVLGIVAKEFGARWAMGVGAVAALLAAIVAVLWMRSTRDLRIRRHPADDPWWRLRVRDDGDDFSARMRNRETATQEIALSEAEARKT
jgi:MFS family permease